MTVGGEDSGEARPTPGTGPTEDDTRPDSGSADAVDTNVAPATGQGQARRRRRDFKAQWLDLVWKTPLITDKTRVFLLALSTHMRDDGYVSVPRHVIEAKIGKSRQRIQDRTDAAIAADWLARISEGRRGHTAVYRACLPDGIATGKLGRYTRPRDPVAMERVSDPPGWVTTTTADPSSRTEPRDDSTDQDNPDAGEQTATTTGTADLAERRRWRRQLPAQPRAHSDHAPSVVETDDASGEAVEAETARGGGLGEGPT